MFQNCLTIAALLALGAGPDGRSDDGFLRCSQRVRHGSALIELRQVHRDQPYRASPPPLACRALVRISTPGRRTWAREWADIDPVGDRFGVSLLAERIGDLRLIAKYGDYDGRLILVASDGRTLDVPGPEYAVQGGWLLTVGASDIREVAIVDLARLRISHAWRPSQANDWGFLLRFFRVGSQLFLAFEHQTVRLDEARGTLVPVRNPPKHEGPDLFTTRPWKDCSCVQPRR